MAIGAGSIWRVRPGGNDANGAGFDATIAGAGTDFTQQDAPQLSLTDIAATAGSTTVTSTAGGFTAAMVGNALRISAGANFATGYYFITGYTNTNTITVDRAPSALGGVAGVGRVGGALAFWVRILNDANAVGDKAVAGNTIYVRGSGSNSPTVADYTTTGLITAAQGDLTDGRICLVSENGRARIQCDGLVIQGYHLHVEGLYFHAINRNGSAHVQGILYSIGDAFSLVNNVVNVDVDQCRGVVLAGNCSCAIGNEIFTAGGWAAHPYSIGLQSLGSANIIRRNAIHHCRWDGINIGNGSALVERNLIYSNSNSGISIDGHISNLLSQIVGNTITGNSNHGIDAQALNFRMRGLIENNLITHHQISFKVGLNCGGTTAQNDRLRFARRNFFGINFSNYANISQAADDVILTGDPYTARGIHDYSPSKTVSGGALVRAAAYPGPFLGAGVNHATTGYLDGGAVQHQDQGGLMRHPGMAGGLNA